MEDNKNILNNKSIKQIKYTTEEIDKCIVESKNKITLLKYYIDHIKNYKELTNDMIYKII